MDLVEDLEFVGGPLGGRRVTAPEGIRVLHFYGFDGEGRPAVATTCANGVPLGSYRYHGAYDCDRTCEHVVVLAWVTVGGDTPNTPWR